MNKYTIYCTEEQTKKARELGAPIKATSFPTPNRVDYDDCYVEYKGYYLEIPTAEQMIGWLEKQGILVDVSSAFNHTNVKIYGYRIGFGFNDYVSDAVDYPTRKEATLAAIDAALDYLKETIM